MGIKNGLDAVLDTVDRWLLSTGEAGNDVVLKHNKFILIYYMLNNSNCTKLHLYKTVIDQQHLSLANDNSLLHYLLFN